MKIGMMVDSYKPYISGITNYVEVNKEYLEKMGHEVFVFTFGDLDYKDNEKNIIRSPGVPLADSGFYLSLRYKRFAWKLLRTMDIVHVHHPFLSGRLALRYCRPMRIPIVYTNHTRYDLYAQAYFPLMPDEVSTGLLQAYMPSFCKAVDSVITPSAGMEKILRELNVEEPIEIIPNGVDLREFKSAKPLNRTKFGYKKNDVILVYAGRIAVEKNLPFLIEAFTGIAKAIPNVHLLLIGGGIQQYEEEIHTLIKQLNFSNRIKAIGRVPYEQLPQYLAMCDVFVTASVTEVHPLSVIEAMGAGLPVMGIESVGVGDTVEDGVTGFLSTEDLPAFTAKLTRLCLDPDLRAKMGKSARRASSAYAIERTTKIMLEHYQAVIKKAKKKKSNWSVKLQKLLQEFVP
jgi:glycosyltransferase involved in cell wall biosynthesis